MRGRPIAPLLLSQQERAYLDKFIVLALPGRNLHTTPADETH
jgi:hypothetical protein